jgi:hypothetical protein
MLLAIAPPLFAAADRPPAPAAAAPPSAPSFAPFKCPDGGPNGGNAPQAMARTAGRTLVLCADTEAAEGRGVVATGVAIHEPAAPEAQKPIFTATDDTNRLRIESVPDQGFALTFEALLPLGGSAYEWAPIAAFDVACGPDGCSRRAERCALSLSSSGRRDLLGQVRQTLRGGRVEPSVAQRLLDDLSAQALLGDDVAAWTVEHFDRLAAVAPETKAALDESRSLLARARAARCEALVPPPDRPVITTTPAERAALLKEKIAQKRAPGKTPAPADPATPPPAPVVDLDSFGWLVGGRWEGQGTMTGGGALHVEEVYRWGPGRKSIRFQARNAGSKGDSAGAVEGILFYETRPAKVILWNIKPGGGLSESAVTRADATGAEFLGPDGRVRMGLTHADAQSRSVEQLQAGVWKPVATATYERRPR